MNPKNKYLKGNAYKTYCRIYMKDGIKSGCLGKKIMQIRPAVWKIWLFKTLTLASLVQVMLLAVSNDVIIQN